jgi:hypothetical protein
MFAERARNIFGHMSIFISACLLGVFAMSSEIVTGRSFGFLLGRTVRYVAQNTSAVLAKTLLDSPCVAFLVLSKLRETGAMLEAKGHEKHDGDCEHKRKAKDDEGKRWGVGIQ